ncbi:hypothetical protein LY01_02767 [Nonlabens xylanidelens]|uniref:Uncharacterized protein n=1 Tax=Nonlabens xylanidelens TaxID=191564 RepID=A0A2S6IFR7_9FLAO|nr:hypothetical protein [Nonlabens xylanidelens]PPK93062.1 hypothetical protein LY01_02767 [Nonlabens xylanidelens]PQJ18734.1 hypothetical protein BST94_06870 [Nonlabens xylanidelens]
MNSINFVETTNGYCHLYVIGKQGSGKTQLIKNLFFTDNKVKNGDDFVLVKHVTDGNHSVKLSIDEVSVNSFENFTGIYKGKAIQIFLVVISSAEDQESIRIIKKRYPNAIVYLFIQNKIDLSYKAYLFKLMKGIRDVFYISGNLEHDYQGIQYILENAIIKSSTNRLESVKTKIKNNLLSKKTALDIGKSDLTSFLEIPELFECVNLESLIVNVSSI